MFNTFQYFSVPFEYFLQYVLKTFQYFSMYSMLCGLIQWNVLCSTQHWKDDPRRDKPAWILGILDVSREFFGVRVEYSTHHYDLYDLRKS